MIELITLAVIVGLLPLAKLPERIGGCWHFKEHAFSLIGILYLCYLLLTGFRFTDSYIGYALFCLACYCSLTVIWTTNIEQSWEDIAKWWAFLGLYLMASSLPVKTVLLMSIVPIPFFLAWGFWQEAHKGELNRAGGHSVFKGSIGNTNHSAAFLAPFVFIALYLAVNVSPYFFILVPFILAGIALTKCYGAILGIIFGSCFIYPEYSLWLLPVLAVGVCSLLILRTLHRGLYDKLTGKKEYNFTARFYYWKIAYELWKKQPVFGFGIRSFRKELYDMQAIMNIKDPSLLGYRENASDTPGDREAKYTAWPTRAHNDYMEMLSDGGIIGFLLLLSLVGFAVYSSIQTGNYILLGGIVCLAVHGMFFYTLSTFSYVPYIMLLACVSNHNVTVYPLPILLAIILVAALIRLALDYAIKPQLAMYWVGKCNQVPVQTQIKLQPIVDKRKELLEKKVTERERPYWEADLKETNTELQKIMFESLQKQNVYIDKAINLAPSNGSAVGTAAKVKAQTDPWLGMHYMERAIHMFDGIMKLPETWAIYGELQKMTGNWEGAKRSLKYAIYLNPCLYQVRELLRQMKTEEDAAALRNRQAHNVLHPKEATG
jgi:O-antigen ligase